ncbi:hypothetical protein HDU79_007963 [Rhizoclosmatium sp. JEL0117]|nr:hypothetical protein HDU79_007963 [Rhizoclosmatium sp. JEL0117]
MSEKWLKEALQELQVAIASAYNRGDGLASVGRITEKVTSSLGGFRNRIRDGATEFNLNSEIGFDALAHVRRRLGGDASVCVRRLVLASLKAGSDTCEMDSTTDETTSTKSFDSIANKLLDAVFSDSSNRQEEAACSVLVLQQLCVRLLWRNCVILLKAPDSNNAAIVSVLDRIGDHLAILNSLPSPSTVINSPLVEMEHIPHMQLVNRILLTLARLYPYLKSSNIEEDDNINDWNLPSILDYFQPVLADKSEVGIHGYWVLGYLKYRRKEFDASRKLLEVGVKECTDIPTYYLNLIGCCYTKMRNYDLALLYLQAALQADSTHTESLTNASTLLRILSHADSERKILIELVKKIITSVQTINSPDLPYGLNPLSKIIHLTTHLPASESAAMLGQLLPHIHRFAVSDVTQQTIPSGVFIRLQMLSFIKSQQRRKARAIARRLLKQNEWDLIAGIVVGRCAVFGKRVFALEKEAEEGVSEWGPVGEEVNVGEEGFSVSEAVQILQRCCFLLEAGMGEGVGTQVPEKVWEKVQTDVLVLWVLKDRDKVRELLTECYVNLSIVQWILGEYSAAHQNALSAFKLSPKNLTVCHNFALLGYHG